MRSFFRAFFFFSLSNCKATGKMPDHDTVTPASSFPSWDTRRALLGDEPGTLSWHNIGNGDASTLRQEPLPRPPPPPLVQWGRPA